MLVNYYDSMLKTPDLFDTFRLFDDYYGTASRSKKWTSSAYRTEATDSGLSLSIDLPGVKSTDLSVQVTGRDVKVTGKLRGEDFKHTYRLSREYDADTADASLEDGVLTLSFKKTAAASVKNIEIKLK
jgi:HSP20 family protein